VIKNQREADAATVSSDRVCAARLEDSCCMMRTLHGIAPELLDYNTTKVVVGSYHLRPEFVESAYYLYHYTGDEKYRRNSTRAML
jgi:hypothetical protein